MSRTAVGILLAITLFGLVVRGWGLDRLGLVHFDEGIYATAAARLADGSLDPGLIAYAPPAYPILASIAFRLLGPSDTAAILISIVAGTAAVPLIGRLLKDDPRAGLVATALVAVWGGQIGFSRMALTDATFLLAWLLGLIAAARLIERPNLGRGLLAGVAIGLAQNTKYNGWLLLPILVAAALPLARARPRGRWVVGLGAAALLAALLDLPWFRFVDDHGGYRALLRHQSGYVLGWSAWARDFRLQLEQVEALSGLPDWGLAGRLAIAAVGLSGLLGPLPDRLGKAARWLSAVSLALVPTLAWWVGLMATPFGLVDSRASRRVLAWSWLALAVLTPLYHPYARLWLPLQATSLALAVGWILDPRPTGKLGRSWTIASAVACLVFVGFVGRGRPLPGLLDPSDSLRIACLGVSAEVANTPDRVPTLARPSALFYLAPRIPIARLADPKSARALGPNGWLLIDESQWRQDDRGGPPIDPARWREVGRWPTSLNLPTWLDLDPAAASRPSTARDSALILYQPARGETSP